MEKHL